MRMHQSFLVLACTLASAAAVCMYSNIPSDNKYYLTDFCDKETACGPSCGDCNWYYAADKQRFGCGSTINCCAGSKCVNLKVIDAGPSCSVEDNAGRPVIDASPLTCRTLSGMSGCGWSDHVSITCKRVASAEENVRLPLGPCTHDALQATGEVPHCFDQEAVGHLPSYWKAYGNLRAYSKSSN